MVEHKGTGLLVRLLVAAAAASLPTGCTDSGGPPSPGAAEDRPIVARAPDEGEVLWFQPSSSSDLGEGALINLKMDRFSLPGARMEVITQTLAASGIPVHLHTIEDELLYVLNGRGTAILGDDRQEVPLETGSVLYVPIGRWHGLTNADPESRMEVLLVTAPAADACLGGFFRSATSLPGHPPLNLPEEEFLALFTRYGMELPSD